MPFVAVRALALLFALSWLIIPGFGLIDLSVTWSPDWPVMLEAGRGLFFSVFVGLAFLVVALFPKRSTTRGPSSIHAAPRRGARAVNVEHAQRSEPERR